MALGWVASFELDLGQQPVQIHLPRLPFIPGAEASPAHHEPNGAAEYQIQV